jgi:hypothetical protein
MAKKMKLKEFIRDRDPETPEEYFHRYGLYFYELGSPTKRVKGQLLQFFKDKKIVKKICRRLECLGNRTVEELAKLCIDFYKRIGGRGGLYDESYSYLLDGSYKPHPHQIEVFMGDIMDSSKIQYFFESKYPSPDDGWDIDKAFDEIRKQDKIDRFKNGIGRKKENSFGLFLEWYGREVLKTYILFPARKKISKEVMKEQECRILYL